MESKHSPGSRLLFPSSVPRGFGSWWLRCSWCSVIRGEISAPEVGSPESSFSCSSTRQTKLCCACGGGKQTPNKLFLGVPVTLSKGSPCFLPGFPRLCRCHRGSSSVLKLTQGSSAASSVKPQQLISMACSFQDAAAALWWLDPWEFQGWFFATPFPWAVGSVPAHKQLLLQENMTHGLERL